MQIIDIEFYNNNTLETELDDVNEFRKLRQYAYLNIELLTNIDLSTYTPINQDIMMKINLAIVYQIDYYRNNGLYIGQEVDAGNNIQVGKVSLGASENANMTGKYSNRFAPIAIDLLDSIGLINRTVLIKDNLY